MGWKFVQLDGSVLKLKWLFVSCWLCSVQSSLCPLWSCLNDNGSLRVSFLDLVLSVARLEASAVIHLVHLAMTCLASQQELYCTSFCWSLSFFFRVTFFLELGYKKSLNMFCWVIFLPWEWSNIPVSYIYSSALNEPFNMDACPHAVVFPEGFKSLHCKLTFMSSPLIHMGLG